MPKRKIFFYRVQVRSQPPAHFAEWDHQPLLTALEQLPFSASAGRYLDDDNDAQLVAFVDRNDRDIAQVRYGRSRRGALPPQEIGGQLQALHLRRGGGLCELVHMMVLKKQRLVVADFNFHGPRVTGFPRYMRQVLGEEPDVTFELLLRGDVRQQLTELGQISMLDLKIRASFADQLAELDAAGGEIGRHLKALRTVGNAEMIQIRITRGRSKSTWLAQTLKSFARKVLQMKHETVVHNAEKFEIAGANVNTGRIDTVDLLGDTYTIDREIKHAAGTLGLDVASAWAALKSAYDEAKAVLDELPTIAERRR